ncbi:hypothetical protein STCU_09929 [Strigomonas culicis]|uniref:Uncharacterized protein n=1 Tax=Strigomonas culicis TaxID=28005 RepID=S9UV81_9TRYP|nr:hypothetical protein STCU_09929 [Strigomonas culicis]|eukprot:EPY18426.1 hypothetical protein STCU_09929 [Strigomonas culicis]
MRRACPDVSACDRDGAAGGGRPSSWSQRQGHQPPAAAVQVAPSISVSRYPAGVPEGVDVVCGDVLFSLSDILSEEAWKDMSLALSERWRAAGEDSCHSLNALHDLPREGELSSFGPLSERDLPACDLAHCSSLTDGVPAAGAVANFAFDPMRKRGGQYNSSSDNSVQSVNTLNGNPSAELSSILITRSSGSMQSGSLRHLRSDNSASLYENDSTVVESESSSRNASAANRSLRREKLVSFKGEWYI